MLRLKTHTRYQRDCISFLLTLTKRSSQNCSEYFKTSSSFCCFCSCIKPPSLYPSSDFPSGIVPCVTRDGPPELVLPFLPCLCTSGVAEEPVMAIEGYPQAS